MKPAPLVFGHVVRDIRKVGCVCDVVVRVYIEILLLQRTETVYSGQVAVKIVIAA